MKILLIGGSKSGKSMLAQRLVRGFGRPMYYWATMEPVDAEDRLRIEKHLSDRAGWGFETIECGRAPLYVPGRVPQDANVLLDSVTALLANEMFGADGRIDVGAGERTARALLTLSARVKNLVCVCDDIWRDAGGYGSGTERYRRSLAEVCRTVTREFDTVCEVTAGILHLWKGRLAE